MKVKIGVIGATTINGKFFKDAIIGPTQITGKSARGTESDE